MSDRERRKLRSHRRIVEVAAEDIRRHGLSACGVKTTMRRAGLTHGGFYNHFPDKTAMLEEAFRRACRYRDTWLADPEDETADRLGLVLARYLSEIHRERPADGCPYPTLAGEIAREGRVIREAFEAELRQTARRLSELLQLQDDPAERRALGLMSLCVGALALARAVPDGHFAEEILAAAQELAEAGFAVGQPAAQRAG